MPSWLRAEVQRALRPDGTMEPKDLLLFTRALAPSPESMMLPAPEDETFTWVIPPVGDGGAVQGKDGSLIDAEWKLAGCCARRGWAFAVANEAGDVIASAHGRPPAWTGGIHGAELWSLLMAALTALPGSDFRVDCMAVQVGTQRGRAWATAPERHLARAWSPLAASLEDQVGNVVWMPAHTSHEAVGNKRLGDGSYLSEVDRRLNDIVDRLAKLAAKADRLPLAQRRLVQALWDRVTAIAIWIGQATVLANEFPDPDHPQSGGKMTLIRDNEGKPARRSRMGVGTKRKRCPDGVGIPAPDGAELAVADFPRVKRARRQRVACGPNTPGSVIVHQRRAAASRRELKRARTVEEAQVSRWLATRPQPAPAASQSSVADRFAALKARVRARHAAE